MVDGLPYPPYELMRRVGSLDGEPDPRRTYEAIGILLRDTILALLPEPWSFERRRVLDFGCGAGRVIRHFAADGAGCELVGYDIDAPSIDWASENLAPLRFGIAGELPPLPEPDASFDLIYALSVFTHLPTTWSAWLRELHRLLAPGGLLVLTFIAEPTAREIDIEWDDRLGMHALNHGNDWDEGGPVVLHAPWWLVQRLGRIFEVVSTHEMAPPLHSSERPPHHPASSAGHGFAVLRRDARPAPAVEELERVDGSDRREVDALVYSLERSWRESATVRRHASALERDNEALRRELATQQDTNARLERALATAYTSRSWRLTAPLRDLRDRVDVTRRRPPRG